MSFRFVPTQRVTENSKKIAKNFKKLKNLVMASFQTYHYGFISGQNSLEKVKKERK